MSNIISNRRQVTITTYARSFRWEVDPGAGFAFPCSEHGVIDRTALANVGQANLDACLSGEYNVIDEGVVTYTHTYTEPAVMRCACGARVELAYSLTNTCDRCGRDYNMSGQALAPRSQWGEETHETLADIMMGNFRTC